MSPPNHPIRWNYQLTPWQVFRLNPYIFSASWLFARRIKPVPSNSASKNNINIVCISDTHLTQPKVPAGDVIIHAGDLTMNGTYEELQAQLDWINSLPHKHKIVIGGNHDLLLDSEYVQTHPWRICEDDGAARADLKWGSITYLQNEETKLQFGNHHLRIYGSPFTHQFGEWAFQYPPIRNVWKDAIPEGIDILVTHGPPKGYLDGKSKGCPWLLKELFIKRPRLIVFGHIHEAYGQETISFDRFHSGYAQIMSDDGRMFPLLTMAVSLCIQKLKHRLGMVTSTGQQMTMINSASIGGIGHIERRPAVTYALDLDESILL